MLAKIVEEIHAPAVLAVEGVMGGAQGWRWWAMVVEWRPSSSVGFRRTPRVWCWTLTPVGAQTSREAHCSHTLTSFC